MKTSPRVYLTGASCAGVSTLGAALAERFAVQHLDVDDFYWMPTDPPYTTKRPPADRVRLIEARQGTDGWVLTGSFDGWGDALTRHAVLIVFVDTPTPVRIERLKARELDRHGGRILPGGDMHEAHLAFRTWASRYDDPTFEGRNRARHEAWLAAQHVPVVRVDGSRPVADLVAQLMAR
ncbi:adenylate kinase [Nitratireductor mangrovi]|uniref:Adenylate kinase n=1 Tax=Nitratireductor mangrovi TaxID=2599600 RepID=A0A5B8KUH6_9HYPH|nr:adenylate kinase [Nitratireductor mangrovi]QDY99197.1 adenylate kinase [Nitratireductor mangrovi]